MSLTLKEIKKTQKHFDLTHSVNGKGFYRDINEDNIHGVFQASCRLKL